MIIAFHVTPEFSEAVLSSAQPISPWAETRPHLPMHLGFSESSWATPCLHCHHIHQRAVFLLGSELQSRPPNKDTDCDVCRAPSCRLPSGFRPPPPAHTLSSPCFLATAPLHTLEWLLCRHSSVARQPSSRVQGRGVCFVSLSSLGPSSRWAWRQWRAPTRPALAWAEDWPAAAEQSKVWILFLFC